MTASFRYVRRPSGECILGRRLEACASSQRHIEEQGIELGLAAEPLVPIFIIQQGFELGLAAELFPG